MNRGIRQGMAVIWIVLLAACPICTAREPGGLEGFGAQSAGGSRGAVVHVTSLGDSGPGTLRAALQHGNRRVVFDRGGVIQLTKVLAVGGSNVTIDGATAPPPGITIRGKPLVIQDVHDVVVQHLRLRDSSDDNLRIAGQARNIVIDHCCSTGAGDGAIDITQDYKSLKSPRDITICWCLLAWTNKAMLASRVTNLSLHHNLFTHNAQRNPQLHGVDRFDFRNNVVWQWGIYGVRVRAGATGNIVGNLFGPSSNPKKPSSRALIVVRDASRSEGNAGAVFTADNLGVGGFRPDALGTTRKPFPAPSVTMVSPQALRRVILEGVGARPLDTADRKLIEETSR